MAPDPQCSALAAAKARSGTYLHMRPYGSTDRCILRKGLSYAAIADKIGESEQHVIDICTGSQRPSAAEFNALAKALNITTPWPPSFVANQLPHDGAHTA
ncbi:hypothetical protein H0H92_007224 [Tricholoma furcatifolium]|nr:hypothetical protein H0H92_007224 [Tricholoma furcatifolium]